MSAFLGFDTSNYTTSAAVYDGGLGRAQQSGRLLPVPDNVCGLRQSDAVFHHTKNLPAVISALGEIGPISAVGVSSRPRDVDGSYMPCFLCGVAAAAAASAAACVPLYEFSHQAGHVAAAAYSSGRLSLIESPMLAWHLSGGTSELLYTVPDEKYIVRCERIGGTSDLAAGQLIDRIGVRLGLPFPCGRELDRLSLADGSSGSCASLSVSGMEMSLSGLENKAAELIASGAGKERVARYIIESVYSSVRRVTERAMKRYPGLPLLCSGGVMSNTLLRQNMQRDFGALFAAPEFSRDNALGIAVLASVRHSGGISNV